MAKILVTSRGLSNARAIKELGWQPKRDLQDMLADSWRWQKMNPKGYL